MEERWRADGDGGLFLIFDLLARSKSVSEVQLMCTALVDATRADCMLVDDVSSASATFTASPQSACGATRAIFERPLLRNFLPSGGIMQLMSDGTETQRAPWLLVHTSTAHTNAVGHGVDESEGGSRRGSSTLVPALIRWITNALLLGTIAICALAACAYRRHLISAEGEVGAPFDMPAFKAHGIDIVHEKTAAMRGQWRDTVAPQIAQYTPQMTRAVSSASEATRRAASSALSTIEQQSPALAQALASVGGACWSASRVAGAWTARTMLLLPASCQLHAVASEWYAAVAPSEMDDHVGSGLNTAVEDDEEGQVIGEDEDEETRKKMSQVIVEDVDEDEDGDDEDEGRSITYM